MNSHDTLAVITREDLPDVPSVTETYTPERLAAIKAAALALKIELNKDPKMIDVWVTIV